MVCAPVVDVVVCVLAYRVITLLRMNRSMLLSERPLAVQSASVQRSVATRGKVDEEVGILVVGVQSNQALRLVEEMYVIACD